MPYKPVIFSHLDAAMSSLHNIVVRNFIDVGNVKKVDQRSKINYEQSLADTKSISDNVCSKNEPDTLHQINIDAIRNAIVSNIKHESDQQTQTCRDSLKNSYNASNIKDLIGNSKDDASKSTSPKICSSYVKSLSNHASYSSIPTLTSCHASVKLKNRTVIDLDFIKNIVSLASRKLYKKSYFSDGIDKFIVLAATRKDISEILMQNGIINQKIGMFFLGRLWQSIHYSPFCPELKRCIKQECQLNAYKYASEKQCLATCDINSHSIDIRETTTCYICEAILAASGHDVHSLDSRQESAA